MFERIMPFLYGQIGLFWGVFWVNIRKKWGHLSLKKHNNSNEVFRTYFCQTRKMAKMTYFGGKIVDFWGIFILFPITFIEKNNTKVCIKKKIKSF